MHASPLHGLGLIVATLILALLLSIVPLPLWAQWGRPEWLALVVLYWVVALPHRMGVAFAWATGLLADILAGAPLGQNALALAVVAWLGQVLYQRFRMYVAWQQAGIVFVLIGIHQLICNWIQALLGYSAPNMLFLLSALISALLWPWMVVLLRYFRRYYDVG